MNLHHIYGPVPSRRLGQSLGIDPIPMKTCNWNCVYCQLGRTAPLTNQRREFIPREEILEEFRTALEEHDFQEIDWVTFVGSGEPTLHQGLGWLIRRIQELTDTPAAVITNGAALHLPEVRQALQTADAVLPSLDAGSPALYQQINRPHPGLDFHRVLQGLADFRSEYPGNLWVEVMLVRGLNDTEHALQDLKSALEPIQPDEIHLSTPTRPPAETWVEPPSQDGLLRAQAILGQTARVLHPASGSFDLSGFDSADEAVAAIITRHPLPEEQIISLVEPHAPEEVREILDRLAQRGKARRIERCGVQFWTGGSSSFPEKDLSERTAPGRKPGSDQP
jgi:wyosine [tRNA(Phe)-imidazoG37] synthetase (radical SAM superfamily)